MNTNELRIGNIILCNGKPETITGVLQYGVYFAFGYCPNVKDFLQPVPLSEQILLEFGFTKEHSEYPIPKGSYSFVLEGVFNLYKTDTGFHFFVEDEINDCSVDVEIESVHRLQNLYFELRNEELPRPEF